MLTATMQPLQKLAGKSKYYYSLLCVTFFLLTLMLTSLGYTFLSRERQKPTYIQSEEVTKVNHLQIVNLPRILYYQSSLLMPSRKNVLIMTPWLAPIVWEGVFENEILHEQFWLQNVTIGLVVFAIGEYMEFLPLFLQSADMYFMVGLRVRYYIFTDQPDSMFFHPIQERQTIVLEVPSSIHQQEISTCHMETISTFSQHRFMKEVDYLVCTHVNLNFLNSVGVEILSSLFGTLHPLFFGLHRNSFGYERQPKSQAYIPEDEGDFYYTGALFGGEVLEVSRLAKFCHQAMLLDQAHGIQAVRHEESYLNKYLLHNKPTKVLSPEYMWDNVLLNTPAFQNMSDNEEILPKITKQEIMVKTYRKSS